MDHAERDPMREPARMGGEKLECPQDLEARGAIVPQGVGRSLPGWP
jgi:hypothetical protein